MNNYMDVNFFISNSVEGQQAWQELEQAVEAVYAKIMLNGSNTPLFDGNTMPFGNSVRDYCGPKYIIFELTPPGFVRFCQCLKPRLIEGLGQMMPAVMNLNLYFANNEINNLINVNYLGTNEDRVTNINYAAQSANNINSNNNLSSINLQGGKLPPNLNEQMLAESVLNQGSSIHTFTDRDAGLRLLGERMKEIKEASFAMLEEKTKGLWRLVS